MILRTSLLCIYVCQSIFSIYTFILCNYLPMWVDKSIKISNILFPSVIWSNRKSNQSNAFINLLMNTTIVSYLKYNYRAYRYFCQAQSYYTWVLSSKVVNKSYIIKMIVKSNKVILNCWKMTKLGKLFTWAQR